MTSNRKASMTSSDRRSGRDRRAAQRFRITVAVEYDAGNGRKPGTIADINDLGCFVLCDGDVRDGEAVQLYLPLTAGMKVPFPAEVTNHVYEIGFAARFIGLTEPQRDFLDSFIDIHRED